MHHANGVLATGGALCRAIKLFTCACYINLSIYLFRCLYEWRDGRLLHVARVLCVEIRMFRRACFLGVYLLVYLFVYVLAACWYQVRADLCVVMRLSTVLFMYFLVSVSCVPSSFIHLDMASR